MYNYKPEELFTVTEIEDNDWNEFYISFNDNIKHLIPITFIDEMENDNQYWMLFITDVFPSELYFDKELLKHKDFINDFADYINNNNSFIRSKELDKALNTQFDTDIDPALQVQNSINKAKKLIRMLSDYEIRQMLINFDDDVVDKIITFQVLKGDIRRAVLFNGNYF